MRQVGPHPLLSPIRHKEGKGVRGLPKEKLGGQTR